MITIGTCSLCSGPVMMPESWSGSEAPTARCGRCFAVPINPFGPRIEMKRALKPGDDEPGDAY